MQTSREQEQEEEEEEEETEEEEQEEEQEEDQEDCNGSLGILSSLDVDRFCPGTLIQ